MCIILGMYTWQRKNGEAVVTSQTMCVSARAYMLRFYTAEINMTSHYRLYKIINTITIGYGLCDFLEMNVYICNAHLCSDL